jgi:hypothetical protein
LRFQVSREGRICETLILTGRGGEGGREKADRGGSTAGSIKQEDLNTGLPGQKARPSLQNNQSKKGGVELKR